MRLACGLQEVASKKGVAGTIFMTWGEKMVSQRVARFLNSLKNLAPVTSPSHVLYLRREDVEECVWMAISPKALIGVATERQRRRYNNNNNSNNRWKLTNLSAHM